MPDKPVNAAVEPSEARGTASGPLSAEWFAAYGVTDPIHAQSIRSAVIGWIDEARELHHAGACPKCVDLKTEERERCAKIAEEVAAEDLPSWRHGGFKNAAISWTGERIASRIRGGE